MAYEVHDGYQKFHDKEPLILEPEDWSFQEWATICKLCGLPLGQTERIVLHTGEMECYVDLSKKVVDADRTYTVTEMCPHCESEVEMRWNTDTQGFKAFCPVCGKRLMLCDECHQLDGGCDYDSNTDSCRHNPAAQVTNELPPALKTVEVAILVEGGLVQGVYASDENTGVSVLDMDTDRPEVRDELEKDREELRSRISVGELHQIY